MQTHADIEKRQRLAIIIIGIIGVLSSFSLTMTVFAWGMGNATIYYLLLYPTVILTLILIIAKIRFAYFLIIILGLAYIILLNKEIGNFFIFRSYNKVLIWVLLLPYASYLMLIPLSISYLTITVRHRKTIILTSLFIAIGFPAFAVAERYNMDYPDSICMDFDIQDNGLIIITGKPGFADTRQFTITTDSKELAVAIKNEGELFYGSYVFVNTRVTKNYRFSKLQSLTIKKLKDKPIDSNLTWTVDEIKGDISFLKP